MTGTSWPLPSVAGEGDDRRRRRGVGLEGVAQVIDDLDDEIQVVGGGGEAPGQGVEVVGHDRQRRGQDRPVRRARVGCALACFHAARIGRGAARGDSQKGKERK